MGTTTGQRELLAGDSEGPRRVGRVEQPAHLVGRRGAGDPARSRRPGTRRYAARRPLRGVAGPARTSKGGGGTGGVRAGGAPVLRVEPVAQEGAVGWLFALMFGAAPRVGTLLLWRARPDRVAAAFGGRRVWPALGVVFLPLTTLLYVLGRPPTGLAGRDWLWLLMALALDVGQAGRPAATTRSRGPDAPGRPPRPEPRRDHVGASGACADTDAGVEGSVEGWGRRGRVERRERWRTPPARSAGDRREAVGAAGVVQRPRRHRPGSRRGAARRAWDFPVTAPRRGP
jgi:hypothetical protein